MTKRWPKLEELDLSVNTDKWYGDLEKRYPNFRKRTERALEVLDEIRTTLTEDQVNIQSGLERIEKILKGEE